MQQDPDIPVALQDEIHDFMFLKNCGEFLYYIPRVNRVQIIQNNSHKLTLFKQIVVKSIREFQRRLRATKLIKWFGVGQERTGNIVDRVTRALKLAKTTDSAQVLLEQCRMIVMWKQECQMIREKIADIVANAIFDEYDLWPNDLWYRARRFTSISKIAEREDIFLDDVKDRGIIDLMDMPLLLSPIDIHNPLQRRIINEEGVIEYSFITGHPRLSFQRVLAGTQVIIPYDRHHWSF